MQAIGAINEKIEGFFDYCSERGLTGRQGVVFPAANAEHLVLRSDVVEALEKNSFHLFPVRTVDEALVAFTGRRAGRPDEPGTLFGEIDRALVELVEQTPDSKR